MDLRNIAIIAHVDHGKTTLVDELLKQSGAFRENQAVAERAMDSNDLERERGITILAKATSLEWKGTRINIVDTPGHADFGGEVERILSMVDGVVLLVDAAEGPMPQTKFVTSKALALGLRPIVVLNKVDKPDAEPDRALDEVFDLFAALGADDDQLDFPHLYASVARLGDTELDGPRKNLDALFNLVVNHVPKPRQIAHENDDFRMLATTLGADPFIGRLLTGRVESGKLKVGATVQALSRDRPENRTVPRLQDPRLPRPRPAGDRGGRRRRHRLARGHGQGHRGRHDLRARGRRADRRPADRPADHHRHLRHQRQPARRPRRQEGAVPRDPRAPDERGRMNVAIKVADTPGGEAFEVSGRGELQMGVLIENMRREGFELSISRPQVIMREDDGQRLEPIEEVTIDVDDEYSGVVIEKLTGTRRGELAEMKPAGAGKTRIIAHVPSRGLIGYHGEFLTDTRGTGVLNRVFHGWAPHKGPIPGRARRADLDGKRRGGGLRAVEPRRARQDVRRPQEKVYQGMIIGEHSRDNDLEVNPLKGKKLTNVRASGTDEAVRLTPPVSRMSLEQAIAYINDDELVEVTPKAIRLRKRHLDPHVRKRAAKTS
jgi:GTP-binding protein